MEKRIKWEYNVVSVVGLLAGDPAYTLLLERAGEEGWELVGLDYYKNLVFKRIKE